MVASGRMAAVRTSTRIHHSTSQMPNVCLSLVSMLYYLLPVRYSGDSFNNVRQIHDSYPEKPIMATEACNCGGPASGGEAWRRGETYVHDILGDLNAFVRGWTDWNILLVSQPHTALHH